MKIPPINLYSIARQSLYEEFLYSLPWIEKKRIRNTETRIERMRHLIAMRNN